MGDKPQPSGIELAGLGLGLALAVLVPLVVGLALDGKFNLGGLGVILGLLLGIFAAVAVVYVRFKSYW